MTFRKKMKTRRQVWVFLLLSPSRMHATRVQAFSSFMFHPALSRSCAMMSLRNTISDENFDPVAVVVPITPCTRICRYNANVFDGQVCIGCFRETYEIGSWESMGPIEKYYALLDAVDRLEEAVTKESARIDESATGTSRQELLRQAEYWKAEAARKD